LDRADFVVAPAVLVQEPACSRWPLAIVFMTIFALYRSARTSDQSTEEANFANDGSISRGNWL